MRTYIDQSRVARNSDRRLHAADLEMSGRFVQFVPAIAQKLAPRAVTTDWPRETERLKGIEDEFITLGRGASSTDAGVSAGGASYGRSPWDCTGSRK